LGLQDQVVCDKGGGGGGEQVLLKSASLPKVRLDLQGCKIDKISLQDNATQVSLQVKNMF
jgi:hypothetical protein